MENVDVRAGASEGKKERLVVVTPPVDVYENSEEIVMLADLPGVKAGDLNVRIENSQLAFSGRQRQAKGASKQFERSFRVPDTVDPARVTAHLESGVLRLQLGKTDANKPRQIPVSATA